MPRPKQYKKQISIDYQHKQSGEDKALDKVFDTLISSFITDINFIRKFKKSKDYKNIQAFLKERGSCLYDFLETS